MVTRPEGYEKERRDCTVRALATASKIPYEQVHSAWKLCGRKDKCTVRTKPRFQKVCKLLNIKAKQVKRHGTVEKLVRQFPKGRLFCTKRSHAFAVTDGIAHDLDRIKSHIQGAWLIVSVHQEILLPSEQLLTKSNH